MQTYGVSGRSSRHYANEGSVLDGLLFTATDAVYPDDYCLKCVNEGRADQKCFHHHWEEKK